jgi:hypothetical protein
MERSSICFWNRIIKSTIIISGQVVDEGGRMKYEWRERGREEKGRGGERGHTLPSISCITFMIS